MTFNRYLIHERDLQTLIESINEHPELKTDRLVQVFMNSERGGWTAILEEVNE